jgi:exosortase
LALLICVVIDGEYSEGRRPYDGVFSNVSPGEIQNRWIVIRKNEGRGAAHERRTEHPIGGLHVRTRHEITEIVNGEEITVLNPLIHGYVGGIIPTEIASVRSDGTKSRYHIGVRRDHHRAERRQAQNPYFPHSFCRVRPLTMIVRLASPCQRNFRISLPFPWVGKPFPLSYPLFLMSHSASETICRSARALPWPGFLLLGMWTWAIWSCAEHWQANPNYSYGWVVPPLALGFGLRRYWKLNHARLPAPRLGTRLPAGAEILAALSFGGLVFLLEYSRVQMWHPEIVLCAICLLAVTSTIAALEGLGGNDLARAEIFPVLFFLTAVPWPPRFEQPITSTLMGWVAAGTAELLHWLGIEAQTSGAAIALRSGLVGITEACSGIRSLQAGIMFGLAMGEWFLLRPARRIVLLLLAIVLALTTNLARTLALSLQAQWHGVDSLDRVHDFIGNTTITALIVGIWVAGKLLAPRAKRQALPLAAEIAGEARRLLAKLRTEAQPVFGLLLLCFVAGIICARAIYARLEAQDRTQTAPFFIARIDHSSGNRQAVVPRDIWNELRPTSGEYVRRESPELPRGGADCFHFFWKPSAWNRFALVHRPDICMPGVGWKPDGEAEPFDVALNGRSIRCYLFRFRRGNAHALELWGVWRNGEAVPLDYQPAQVFGAALPPPALHLEGKRRSATEIIACSVIADGTPPSSEIAVALLRSVFQYKAP